MTTDREIWPQPCGCILTVYTDDDGTTATDHSPCSTTCELVKIIIDIRRGSGLGIEFRDAP